MSYWLGVDVGSTFTAAALCRVEAGRRALPEVIPLGTRSTAVSSVVYLGQDGEVIVGEAAERRAVTHPDRVVREFKRRIGDEVPMVIGGTPHSAPEITAKVIRWVVERVAQREGGPAAGIVITHPASWGAYKTRMIAQALAGAASPTSPCSPNPRPPPQLRLYRTHRSPVARSRCMTSAAGPSTPPWCVRPGPRRSACSAIPRESSNSGGVDFDEAVFDRVRAAVPRPRRTGSRRPATLAATAALRRECTAAKEALSVDTEASIPVLAAGPAPQVRLIRAEFEEMIRAAGGETVDAAAADAPIGAASTGGDLDGGAARRRFVADSAGRAAALRRARSTGRRRRRSQGHGRNRGGALRAPRLKQPMRTQPLGASGGIHAHRGPTCSPVTTPQRPVVTSTPLDIAPVVPLWRRVGSRRGTLIAAAFVAFLLAIFLPRHSGWTLVMTWPRIGT